MGRHDAVRPWILAGCFIGSGFSALAYQVILSRYVQLIVGGTAYAITALLIAFMLGNSIGAALGGRLADRWTHPLRIYAIAEGLIGLYCVSFPVLFGGLEELYSLLMPGLDAPGGARNAVRFFIGVAAFLLPSIFMGVTTPAFARALAGQQTNTGQWLARLYGWNTLGAALGALSTAYVLVPTMGLVGSMVFAAAINAVICVASYRMSVPVPVTLSRAAKSTPRGGAAGRVIVLLLTAAFASGLLSFGLEIIWTHLLAILLGNSVYAFGLMLGSLLLGLAIGSLIARRVADPPERALEWLGTLVACAGAVVVLTLGVWDEIPDVFLWMAQASPTFALMEAVRFLVAMGLMVLPTAMFGGAFPLILRLAARHRQGFAGRIGLVYAVNTVGAVVGSLLGSYVLLPWLGSLDSLRLLGGGLCGVGALLLATLGTSAARNRKAALAALMAAGAVVSPVTWNFNALNMATAIYLGDSVSDTAEIVFREEDPTGGLTTVVDRHGVRTLLTNGKFQGDNSEEVPIQHRLANIPTLFTKERKRALVIGLGTGVTLASVAAHGFEETVCAEFSEPIIDAARAHFSDVNGGVLDWPNVKLIVEDGRSVLFESKDRYDLVSVEVNSIWFAGVGAIYSREFYELTRQRLRRNGVLLQWFPIHHLSPRNLFVVVNTVRSVFPHVSVWTHRHQAFVIASNEPQAIDLASVRADLEREPMQHYLRELASGSPLELLEDVVVTDRDVDAFLDAMARLLRTDRSVVSTDTWPTLEYETPKDILDNFSYFQNRGTFARFRSRASFPFRGEPTPREAQIASTAFTLGWNDPRALPKLARLWAEHPDLSAVTSRWLLDELTGDDILGADFAADPLLELSTRLPDIQALSNTVVRKVTCEKDIPVYSGLGESTLRMVRSTGASVDGTSAEAVVDGVSHPDLGKGWRVRPEGSLPWVEVELTPARELERLSLVVEPIDGAAVRTRILGKSVDGQWLPLASGGQVDEVYCRGVRRYELSSSAPKLSALRIELHGQARSHRMALHEVIIEERDGASPPTAEGSTP